MNSNTWNIDLAHSGIGFSVRHMVIAKVKGRFQGFSGSIAFDPKNPEASRVSVAIDASTIDTNVAERDNHLRSADFLSVETFPQILFTSTQIEKRSDDRFLVHGDLTIRGVTKRVTLEAEYGGEMGDPWGQQRIGFSATTSINRTDFGLKWNQLLETGGVLVGERIDISLDIQAVKAAAARAA